MKRAILSAIIAAGLLASVGQARIIYVNGTTGNDNWTGLCQVWDGDTCGPKRTIQAGIDVADPGDTVQVADGTYTGEANRDMDFGGKDITVQSENGPDACIIDCDGTEQQPHRGFVFQTGETQAAVLQGFTIMNGHAAGYSWEQYGGGVLCYDYSDPTIAACTISGNTAALGGGISCYRSEPTIVDCTITDNVAYGDFLQTGGAGGGVFCTHSNPRIMNSTIARNSADVFGGGICSTLSDPILINCTITENTARYDGGGLYSASSGDPRPTNCLILHNRADWYGGGICCASNGRALITNCTIAANNAFYGGGMYCDASDPEVMGSIFSTNVAEFGAEIALEGYSRVPVSYSDVYGEVFVAGHSYVIWLDGNLTTDPLFVDPANSEFHLSPDSPCIGTGDPRAFGLDEFDMDGQPRVMGGRVDMGTDEFTDDPFVYGNANCDDAWDSFDIDPFVLALTDPLAYGNAFPDCFVETADINGDGILDAFDIDPFVELLTGG